MGPPVAASRDPGSHPRRREPAASNSDASRAHCILRARGCGLDASPSSWGGRFCYFVLKSGSPGGARTFEAAGGAVFPRHGASNGPAQSGNRNRAMGTGRRRPGDRRRIRESARAGDTERRGGHRLGENDGQSTPPASCAGALVAVAHRRRRARRERRVLLLDVVAALWRSLPRPVGTGNESATMVTAAWKTAAKCAAGASSMDFSESSSRFR